MKKLFSVLLAVAMICTMSISAFAADVTTSDSKTADLKVKYVEGTGKSDAYAATIKWESMVFTYTSGGQYWDTDSMTWKDSDSGSWSDASKVTITNKSSQAITVKFKYDADKTNANGVTGIKVNNADIVEAGYTVAAATAGTNGSNGTAKTEDFTIQPVGTYTGTNTDAVTVGTITISLD